MPVNEVPPRTRVSTEGVASRAVHLSQCKLVVLKGSQRGKEFVISGDVIRIGKVDENDLALPEETVSRVHCEILRDAKGHLLRDLHSTNGTFLDGAEIKEAYIRPGSIITVGTVQLKFQPFEERIEILPSEKDSLGPMVGGSLKMREIFGLVERIAPTEATVLIEGETGTGKDLVARTIHDLSKRKDKPFVIVDCGAVSGTLIESELFGHEKGAFTGATTTRIGAFEAAGANGGTIFLDELGELSLDLQPKLLRVLEQREIRRVGGNRTIKVDIRVIAATKQDLRKEVQKGQVPRGSLLPPVGGADPHAFSARAQGGHPAHRAQLPRADGSDGGGRRASARDRRSDDELACRARLAGQRARAAQRARARRLLIAGER